MRPITLVEVSYSHYLYEDIRNKHYVENNGCMGRQIHYMIYYEDDYKTFGPQPIGIISGASPVWACKPRDDYFGINTDNRVEKLDYIIDNTVFRLEDREKNLASYILSRWRKQITKDWQRKYKILVKGFETFVYGENRNGHIYSADNWQYVGMTQGTPKKRTGKTFIHIKDKDKKLIYCKTI